jgi:hypothetical protein
MAMAAPSYDLTPLGAPMLKHFLFSSKYKNLNHGKFIRGLTNSIYVSLSIMFMLINI